MKGFKSIVVFLVAGIVTLTGCGGGGDDGSSSIINAGNVQQVTTHASLALYTPLLPMEFSNSINSLIRSGTIPSTCDTGSVVATHDDVNPDGLWGNGENLSLNFSQCAHTDFSGDVYTLDGELLFSNVDMTGNRPALGFDPFVISFDLTLNNYTQIETTPEGTLTIVNNGSYSYEESYDDITADELIQVTALNLTTDFTFPASFFVGAPPSFPVNLSQIAITDGTVVIGENDVTRMMYLEFDGELQAPSLRGAISYSMLPQLADGSVVFKALASDESAAVFTMDNLYVGDNVQFEVDEDGDGIYETTINSTMDDLALGAVEPYILLMLFGLYLLSRKYLRHNS